MKRVELKKHTRKLNSVEMLRRTTKCLGKSALHFFSITSSPVSRCVCYHSAKSYVATKLQF